MGLLSKRERQIVWACLDLETSPNTSSNSISIHTNHDFQASDLVRFGFKISKFVVSISPSLILIEDFASALNDKPEKETRRNIQLVRSLRRYLDEVISRLI